MVDQKKKSEFAESNISKTTFLYFSILHTFYIFQIKCSIAVIGLIRSGILKLCDWKYMFHSDFCIDDFVQNEDLALKLNNVDGSKDWISRILCYSAENLKV